MKAIRFFCRMAAVALFIGAPEIQAMQGTITQVTSINNELRFWIKECGYNNFYYVRSNDASHDQVKLLLMAAKFSGRPVSVPQACPSGSNLPVTQVDLMQY